MHFAGQLLRDVLHYPGPAPSFPQLVEQEMEDVAPSCCLEPGIQQFRQTRLWSFRKLTTF